ncbi:cation diffusion facilitator family transporter [Parvimonas sp. KA00067]|uniref:cation diffusion facilitator family transporter n=1 Tax=Parvimonas sp. KA00067 TaxID=1588755 RepID=UPI00079122D1|nr:cation diffusion facilitator family transporter [Parvimonas sp. KA00067]KXB66736.1 cation diffusion facilitator family transporter [Parvimonas sp. KA00067]
MIDKKILSISRIENTDKYDRKKVGYFSGLIGTSLNVTLGVSKFLIGIFANSVSITADAVNNFSDAIYSFATVLGFKFSSAPPDKDHPYGHGRVEYITTLIISMMIMLVGLQFTKTSIERIISPEKIVMNKIGIAFLVVSIFVKLWMSLFNRKLGKAIDSSILRATSVDCLSDVFTTSVVLIAMIFADYTTFPVDGVVGLVVSAFILFSGFSLAKETVSQLIGEAPSVELIKSVLTDIEKHKEILGIHNYTFHTYGNNKKIATVDVEVDSEMSLIKAHNLMSLIEKEIYEKYEIVLVIHVEPVGGNFTEREIELKEITENWKNKFSYIKSMHDFAIYKQGYKYFVGLQLILDGNKLDKNFDENSLKSEFEELIKNYDEELKTSITILYEYF